MDFVAFCHNMLFDKKYLSLWFFLFTLICPLISFCMFHLFFIGAKRVQDVDALRGDKGARLASETMGSGETSLGDALWCCANLYSDIKLRLSQKRVMIFTCRDEPHGGDSVKDRQARTKASDLKETGASETNTAWLLWKPLISLKAQNWLSNSDFTCLCRETLQSASSIYFIASLGLIWLLSRRCHHWFNAYDETGWLRCLDLLSWHHKSTWGWEWVGAAAGSL